MRIRGLYRDLHHGRFGVTENVHEGFLNNPQYAALPFIGQSIDLRSDLDAGRQGRARRKSAYELLDRNLKSVGKQILRMQQVGEGTDFPERLIDRRVEIIAEFPRITGYRFNARLTSITFKLAAIKCWQVESCRSDAIRCCTSS